MRSIRSISLLLMAAYMLMLAVFPCQDHESAIGHARVHALEQAQDHHQEDHDICSPFCICHCCGSVVIMTAPYTWETFGQDAIRRSPIHFPGSLYQDPSAAIWQPPKIQA